MRLKTISETKSLFIAFNSQYIIEEGQPVKRGSFTTEAIDKMSDKPADAFVVSPVSACIDAPSDIVTNFHELNLIKASLDHMALAGE